MELCKEWNDDDTELILFQFESSNLIQIQISSYIQNKCNQ